MKRFLPVVLLIISLISGAQNTMYFMDRLPQNIAYNPAIVPNMKFFIGLPGITAQAYNSGFTFNQFDKFKNNLADKNYSPDEFVSSIGDYNLLTLETRTNLLSFGFKLKEKNYLSFMVTMNGLLINKAASDIAYLVTDLDDITREDFPIVVDDISMNANVYTNFGFTYSRIINNHLTLGITPRINFNQAGIKTTNISYRIDLLEPGTEFEDYEQTFSGETQIALPTEMNPEAIENGEVTMGIGLLPKDWEQDITLGSLLKNKSLMVDIGATYEIEKWTLSASILNIGTSVFKTNSYLLNGANNKVTLNETEKIEIGIPARLYIGAMRQFSPKWNYALLFNNNFYSTGQVTTATASLNGYVGKVLSTSVSYTTGYKFNNLGIGLRFRFIPGADLYLVTDNIFQAFNYKNAYRFTAAAGINIAIGAKQEETVPTDIPMDSY